MSNNPQNPGKTLDGMRHFKNIPRLSRYSVQVQTEAGSLIPIKDSSLLLEHELEEASDPYQGATHRD